MKSAIFTLFLISFSFSFPLIAQDKADIASEGLKGAIKSITIRGYSAETVEGKTKKMWPLATTIKKFNTLGYLMETISGTGYDTVPVKGTNVRGARIVYKYDDQAVLTGSVSYYANGNLEDSSIHEVDKLGNRTFWKIYKGSYLVWEYIKEYDNVGNLLETNDFHNGYLETRHTYRYDEYSRCTKESGFDENGRLKWEANFKYDAAGNKIEASEFTTETGAEIRRTYKYNKRNKPVEEYEFLSPDPDKFKKIVTNYDDEGNVIEIKQYAENGVQVYEGRFDKYGNHLADIAYNEDGTLHDKITAEYRYDSKGNETEEALHFTDGSAATSISKYEYDHENNWVKKTVFEDGEATRLIEREIQYYN